MIDTHGFARLDTVDMIAELRRVADKPLPAIGRETQEQLAAAADRLDALLTRVASCASGEAAERATVSEIEAVYRERKAFEQGACVQWRNRNYTSVEIGKCAEEEYPLPKIVRPLRVTLSDGNVWSYDATRGPSQCPFVLHTGEKGGHWSWTGAIKSLRLPSDVTAFARILSGETETVECDP